MGISKQTTIVRVPLLAAQTSDNGAPSGASAGVDHRTAIPGQFDPNIYSLELAATATGALSYDAYIWGYEAADDRWARLGSGSSRGHVNGGVAISGTTAENWRDVIVNLGYLDRLYIEVLNSSGTSFSLDAVLTAIEGR